MIDMNGVRFVFVDSIYSVLFGSRLLVISVFVGFLLISIVLFIFRCCRCDVSGLFCILMLKNLRCFL